MTFDKYAKQLSARLRECKTKERAIIVAKEIIIDINQQTYSGNRMPLTSQDKSRILGIIVSNLPVRLMKFAQHNDMMLSGVDRIIEQLQPAARILIHEAEANDKKEK